MKTTANLVYGVSLGLGLLLATGASAQTTSSSPIAKALPNGSGIDYKNALPFPLPQASQAAPTGIEALKAAAVPAQAFGPQGVTLGAGSGTGVEHPVKLFDAPAIPAPSPESREFGTSNQPFSTSRANAYGDKTVNYYPFRAAGKLFFQEGTSNYVCSASLIKPGVVVTAAHCVIKYGSGTSGFYHNWQFVPAYQKGQAPYGTWSASYAQAMNVYINGTDSCANSGVICQNDVALIVLNPQNGAYPGTTTGWLNYGWNGYSYNSSGQAEITQLGYPVALDGGLVMERNDSQGVTNGSLSNNTVIGSLMTGGSSGGPWIVNLGNAPTLVGTSFGTSATHNVVVGTTSWGYTDLTVKQQGAAPFTSNNITVLVSAVCSKTPGAC